MHTYPTKLKNSEKEHEKGLERVLLRQADRALPVNTSSIVYFSLPTVQNSTGLIIYGLYLYFLGLGFSSTTKALFPFIEKRSHVAVWNWLQLFRPRKYY